MRFPDARILIFTKAPVPGQVKTRLIPRLGAEGAVELHRWLLQRTAAELADSELCPVQLCCAPDTGHPLFRQLALRHGLTLRSQCEGDLGRRMFHAAESALEHAESLVLVGCDCPALDAGYVLEALRCLLAGDDAVLGPAEDGGYVLLGLKRGRLAPELFTGLPWGGSQVLAQTRQRMAGLAWSWSELDTLWDLDRPEDLDRLRQCGYLDPLSDGGAAGLNRRP